MSFSACSKEPIKNAVIIDEAMSLTDRNRHTVNINMSQSTLDELFAAPKVNDNWATAHENLEIHYTSWKSYDDPEVNYLKVSSTVDVPLPSWETHWNEKVGDSIDTVFENHDIEDANYSTEYIDLLYAVNPENPQEIYPIEINDMLELPEGAMVYRLVYQFKGQKIYSIALGNLEGMAEN